MIVCSCNVLSDRQVSEALVKALAPVRTLGQVYRCLGCRPRCGGCARTMRILLERTAMADCNARNGQSTSSAPITLPD